MPLLKPVVDTDPILETPAEIESPSISLVTGETRKDAMPSPALQLQSSLHRSIQDGKVMSEARVADLDNRKIPLGWTLVGMTAVCGIFWAGVWAVLS